MNENKIPAFLILENGRVFKGYSFGASGTSVGEAVFTTGMTGYQETLTDPSYSGQIIIQTFPLIGNYGVNLDDYESGGNAKQIAACGYVVREWCENPSNFRENGTVNELLKRHNIVGLYGIDTRALTRIIREYGVMNAVITTDESVTKLDPKLLVTEPVKYVSVSKKQVFPSEDEKYNIALIDYGYKKSIKDELVKRGCTVTVFPYDTGADEILNGGFDGVMLSNGPGDPQVNVKSIDTVRDILNSDLPLFGICLGHQLAALASGARTVKLKYGHRGANQPVLDIRTGKTYITSQNHGYAVVNDSVNPDIAEISHTNANDKTSEGIRYKNGHAFTVQFHPEAHGGPLDTAYLFDEFLELIQK
ncbi:MAG: carbamoyl phosphate synthase small subunit [Oscillospiraceae bacterium]|jgi:carbamoyl-phosphate synthase small subunit|nr:carbamoyl phosphate synthase small subunit [Oscillospiraceae bacterium]